MTALAEAPPAIVPGVYDIPEDDYHADPVPCGSLSSSGARRLLPPSCPAIFRHEQLNPPGPKKVFDLGSAAHKLVLGSGPELVLVDKARWDDNVTKAKVADIRARGGIPLKRAEYDQVHDMADALRRHRVASALFDPDHGQPEQTLIWQDTDTGVWCRARLDWLPHPSGRRLIVPDYKTGRSAECRAVAKAVHEHGYHQQTEWYLRGAQTLGLADEDASFVFVFQEKEPPYLVNVVQLDDEALYVARERNRRAMEIYAACVEADYWPGYPDDDIHTISLPAWATREENL